MTGKLLTPAELADRQRNALAELDEFYGELRNAKSRLARRALTHINALVDELHDACQLLAKYRQHVQDCESIDFLDRIGEAGSEVTFTPAEVAVLMALRGEDYGPAERSTLLTPSEHTELFTRANEPRAMRPEGYSND